MPVSHSGRRCPGFLAGRLKALRCRIHRKSLDGYLVTGPHDQFHLTGFDGEDGAALILPRRVFLLTDGRFAEAAARQAPWARAIVRTGPLARAIGDLLTRSRLKRVGFEPANMSVALHRDIRRACPGARLIPLPDAVGDLRICKDAGEVEAIERAIRVAETAFRRVLRRVRPGMTERQLAGDLEHEMVRLGADGPAFGTIVAEGPNASLPHARPGDRVLRPGSAVLIDWGARVGHYCSDLTRVIFVRKIPPRLGRMYRLVLAAQEAAIAAIRPGQAMKAVDAEARRQLRRGGMERRFTHGLGHGLGLQVHEPPSLSARSIGCLKPGMVVTVEPGVYVPGIGGVRIEDDVLVTGTGCRVLSKLSRRLEDCVAAL